MRPLSLAVLLASTGAGGVEALVSTTDSADGRMAMRQQRQLSPAHAAEAAGDPLAEQRFQQNALANQGKAGQRGRAGANTLPAWLEKPPYWLPTPPEWGPPPQHIYTSWYSPQTIPQPVFKASNRYSQFSSAYASSAAAAQQPPPLQPQGIPTSPFATSSLYPAYSNPYAGAEIAGGGVGVGSFPYPYPSTPLPLDLASAPGYASSPPLMMLETDASTEAARRKKGSDEGILSAASSSSSSVDADAAAQALLRAEAKWGMDSSRLLAVLELHHSLVEGNKEQAGAVLQELTSSRTRAGATAERGLVSADDAEKEQERERQLSAFLDGF